MAALSIDVIGRNESDGRLKRPQKYMIIDP